MRSSFRLLYPVPSEGFFNIPARGSNGSLPSEEGVVLQDSCRDFAGERDAMGGELAMH